MILCCFSLVCIAVVATGVANVYALVVLLMAAETVWDWLEALRVAFNLVLWPLCLPCIFSPVVTCFVVLACCRVLVVTVLEELQQQCPKGVDSAISYTKQVNKVIGDCSNEWSTTVTCIISTLSICFITAVYYCWRLTMVSKVELSAMWMPFLWMIFIPLVGIGMLLLVARINYATDRVHVTWNEVEPERFSTSHLTGTSALEMKAATVLYFNYARAKFLACGLEVSQEFVLWQIYFVAGSFIVTLVNQFTM